MGIEVGIESRASHIPGNTLPELLTVLVAQFFCYCFCLLVFVEALLESFKCIFKNSLKNVKAKMILR